jgi:hypothetical protein
MTSQLTLPNDIRNALEKVLAYAMLQEEDDYAATHPVERDEHIYASLLTLRVWLNTGVVLAPRPDVQAIRDLAARADRRAFAPRG